MNAIEFAAHVITCLPYAPNDQQIQVIGALARFCSPTAPDDAVFLLNGYAGTGKTSLTGALVRALQMAGIPSVLLAPTGRAAKVFAKYSGHPAYTIHRKIYRHPAPGDTYSSVHAVRDNRHKTTIFIVDEASMIGSVDDKGGNLLEDLIHYVYTGDNCRMILLGDTAQLPPVGCAGSPAMSADVLRSYGLRVTRATITTTARQGALSGILFNATWLRHAMKEDPLPVPKLFTDRFADVREISGEDLPEALDSSYSRDGTGETIVITRSNARAAGFNRAIRAKVLYFEEEIAPDELMLVAKNNYFWSRNVKGIDFIANGETVSVKRVHGTESRYGLRFADVTLSLPDHDVEFDAKIMLDTLVSESAGLPQDRTEKLYYSIMDDPGLFEPSTPAQARLKALKSDPYWNALQVKYAYAVTCHKAQGGQWLNVFVDMGYIPHESMGMDFYRWLYTAVSRARSNLYFINPGSVIRE